MAASNKNELPLGDPSEDDNTGGVEPTISVNADSEPPPEEATSVEPVAEYPITGEEEPITLDDGPARDDDPDAGENFQPVPMRADEFFVRLSKLGEWQHHPRRGSRVFGAHAKSLLLSAANPASLRPIVVLPAIDGIHPIVDGRFLWAAINEMHDGNEDVEVRCILFDGDENEAVVSVCDAVLGTIGASAIEQAQALLSLTQTNGIGRTAIANRYAGLTVSKVSNMLIAAETKTTYPSLFDILHEPDRAPISYGVELNKVRKAMGPEFQAVLDRAADLAANGERCKPTDAFEALQIEQVVDSDALERIATRSKPIVPLESEPILGYDDQPVAAYERLADNIDRIRLPDVSGMSPDEREAAAEACIVQIRRHFGLAEQG
ncbi:hypothetical protein ACVWZA_001892 [Sphingomonas sp. UYAg733]